MHIFIFNACLYYISPTCFGVLYIHHLQGELLLLAQNYLLSIVCCDFNIGCATGYTKHSTI
jgi:hypothetical protein